MTEFHRHQSTDFLEDAEVALLALAALYEDDYVENRAAKAAAHNTEIRAALKQAEVHAILAVAESLASIPTPDEIRALLQYGASV